jgi:hypothetical protein
LPEEAGSWLGFEFTAEARIHQPVWVVLMRRGEVSQFVHQPPMTVSRNLVAWYRSISQCPFDFTKTTVNEVQRQLGAILLPETFEVGWVQLSPSPYAAMW